MEVTIMTQIIKAMLLGAASAVGCIIVQKISDKLSDPVNQAKIKKVINTAKREFSK
jgi:hypothetical protein